MRRLVALALLLGPALASPAAAQTTAGGGTATGSGLPPPATASLPPAYVAPQVEHLFGDPWGIRADLANQGIYVLLDFVSEFAGNVTGGITRGATFANQLGLEIDIDWQRRAGITGLSSHVIFVNRSGYSDSLLIGDNVAPVQEIYGASGNVLVHLVSAYAEETLLDNRIDIAVGQMNVENDFASSPLYCNSMNNAICGDPKALPAGDLGHSAFPDGVWAGRIRVRPTSDTYVETGVYEVNQGLYTNKYFGSGFPNNISQASGVYVPVEIAYEPALGANDLLGHYKFGFGFDSTLYKSFFSALPTTAGEPAPGPFPRHAVLGAGGPDAASAGRRRPGRHHRARRICPQRPECLGLCRAVFRRPCRPRLLACPAGRRRGVVLQLQYDERPPRHGAGGRGGIRHPVQQRGDRRSDS
jgi:porin